MRRTIFVLLTLALTACFEAHHPVTEREVVGSYLNLSGYEMRLAADHQYVVLGKSRRLLASGTWQLEENGRRIVFQHCLEPSSADCQNLTKSIMNQPIGKSDKEIVIGNGEPPEDDYTKPWVTGER